MDKKRYLVTSALPYSNGRLHVGHIAGAYLPADIYVRYRRARGDEVRYICGSDDNGVSALISARKEGRTVEELTAHYNSDQKQSFEGLGIVFDIFGGTHQPDFVELHNKLSQEIFLKIYENGFLEKKKTEQLYDAEADQFLPDRFVKGKCYHTKANGQPCDYEEAYGDQCESCGNAIDPLQLFAPVSTISGTSPETRETIHWYLKLGKLEKEIRSWLESKVNATDDCPAWREHVLNFTLGQIKQGLPDRAMTRDLKWGVPVPLDDPDAAGKCLYVWFDAPIGYVSFTASMCKQSDEDWKDYERWWKDSDCRIVHFIGEDNTIFHAITWPAMLMAEGSYQLPWQVVANAFLNIKFPNTEEQKISKSRGTAIWISDYLKEFDPDPLRFYLTTIAPESQRTAFDFNDFCTRNNNELLNALGNFINRTMTFASKYCDSRLPEPGSRNAEDRQHLDLIAQQVAKVADNIERFQFKLALGEVMSLARASNSYFDLKQPWKQRKEDTAACGVTINICLQTVKALMTIMAPFLPFTATRIAEMLNLDYSDQIIPWTEAVSELVPGHILNQPTILFKRIDLESLQD